MAEKDYFLILGSHFYVFGTLVSALGPRPKSLTFKLSLRLGETKQDRLATYYIFVSAIEFELGT